MLKVVLQLRAYKNVLFFFQFSSSNRSPSTQLLRFSSLLSMLFISCAMQVTTAAAATPPFFFLPIIFIIAIRIVLCSFFISKSIWPSLFTFFCNFSFISCNILFDCQSFYIGPAMKCYHLVALLTVDLPCLHHAGSRNATAADLKKSFRENDLRTRRDRRIGYGIERLCGCKQVP
jgi:hypothetical protein